MIRIVRKDCWRIRIQPTQPYYFRDQSRIGQCGHWVNDYLYSFACGRDGTVKPCKLARVEMGSATSLADWEYLSQGGENVTWVKDSGRAGALFHGNDILSVFYNEYFDRYMAIYSRPISTKIEMRSARNIAGPWSAPTTVAIADPGGNANGWVYDILAHTEYAEQNGKVQYLTYSSGTGLFRSEFRLLQVEFEAY